MERLETNQGHFTAYLNRLPTNQGAPCFHISFVDKKNRLHILVMRHDGGKWVFADEDEQPDWIRGLQEQLNVLIQKEISETFVEVKTRTGAQRYRHQDPGPPAA